MFFMAGGIAFFFALSGLSVVVIIMPWGMGVHWVGVFFFHVFLVGSVGKRDGGPWHLFGSCGGGLCQLVGCLLVHQRIPPYNAS